jgi:hypothetical protein
MGSLKPNSGNAKNMTECQECQRLREQLLLLQHYIVSRRGAEKIWYDRCQQLEAELETLRKGGVPKKPKKRQVTVELP